MNSSIGKFHKGSVIRTEGYHHTQLKVFFTMITLYTFYFASNYNLGPATKFIQAEYGYSNETFGVLFTIFTLGFGLGQFVAGYLGDRYNPKMLMFIGAVLSSMANICFGLSSHMVWFSIFWGVNALALSLGWSPGCSIMFRWTPPPKWGLFMGLFDAFAFLGGIIVYPIAAFAISFFSWRGAFFIPPALLFVWALLFLKVVKSNPSEAGLTTEWESGHNLQQKVNARDYIDIIKNLKINLICLAAICSQFVRWGLVNWMIKIMAESQETGGFGISIIIAASIASAMHWGGAFFSIGMGIISDKVFNGYRWQTIAIGFVISSIALFIVFFYGKQILMVNFGKIIFTLLLFFAGGCIQGVQAPLFSLPGDILGSRIGGTGVGYINGWSYIGASFTGATLGFMMDQHGFMSIIVLMAIISLLGSLIISFVRR